LKGMKMSKKLKLFRLNGTLDDLDKTLQIFVSLTCVYPILANNVISHTHGLSSVSYENPWSETISELGDIEKDCGITISPQDIDCIDDSLSKVSEYIHHTHEKLKDLDSDRKEAETLIKKYSDALMQVKNISNLDISIDDIFSCEYINPRFGKLPTDSYDVLKLYQNKPFILQVFSQEKNYYWCMYLATDKHEREIDNIFSSLFFERIYIPDFIHGTPEQAYEVLSKEIQAVDLSLQEIKSEINETINKDIVKLSHVKGEMILLEKMYDSRKFVVSMGKKFIITGYVHELDATTLIDKFSSISTLEIDIVPASLDMRFKPPKKIKRRCK